MKLHLHRKHNVFLDCQPLFGEVITGLKLVTITGIVLKLCVQSTPTLFALNVCHRSIKTAIFSVHYSLRMLLFTLYIKRHVS